MYPDIGAYRSERAARANGRVRRLAWLRKARRGAVLGFALAILTVPAFAQTKAGSWDISLTPRFWYMILNSNSYSDSTFVQQTFETVEIPLYGGTIRVAPPYFESTDFLLNGFYGETDVRGVSVTAGGASTRHATDVARADIELLVRHKLPKSDVYLFYGLRYVYLEEDTTLDPGFAFAASGTNRLDEQTDFYMVEGGMSMTNPIGDTDRHFFFANLTGGVGYQARKVRNRTSGEDPDEYGFTPFLDINTGYELRLADRISAQLRYRAFIFYERTREEMFVLHGPEVGVTIRF